MIFILKKVAIYLQKKFQFKLYLKKKRKKITNYVEKDLSKFIDRKRKFNFHFFYLPKNDFLFIYFY